MNGKIADYLDFGANLSPSRAREQADGAIALFNMLERHSVAYLADEVGMGKTYVALGVMALMRKKYPQARVLYILPRSNIQTKWINEYHNFVSTVMVEPDLNIKSLDGSPNRRLVKVERLRDLIRMLRTDVDAEYFLRISSFSLPMGERTDLRALRDELQSYLPWLNLDLRSDPSTVKATIARALCSIMPEYDLVICDEAHNLKGGFHASSPHRNRELAFTMGHPHGQTGKEPFPNYFPKAKRVLLLSATPIETDFSALYRQLEVFGKEQNFGLLNDDSAANTDKHQMVKSFLIRRITGIQTRTETLTKNRYRRLWRSGGVSEFDKPIEIKGSREKLTLALVQKKVSDILGHTDFNNRFQMGMLASFESFLQTAVSGHDTADEDKIENPGNFDGADQTEDPKEREGIDVQILNKLAHDHLNTFSQELAHPKMDSLVSSLSNVWDSGEKALIFVRRVASVKELKRKLDAEYDLWIKEKLCTTLPKVLLPDFEEVFKNYLEEKREARLADQDIVARESAPLDLVDQASTSDIAIDTDENQGGIDTFFSYFFRGEGPKGFISGASLQRQFKQSKAVLSTYFEPNYAHEILSRSTEPTLISRLAAYIQKSETQTLQLLSERTLAHLENKHADSRRHRFFAVQAAFLELVQPVSKIAKWLYDEKFSRFQVRRNRSEQPNFDVLEFLDLPTFWSVLSQKKYMALHEILWPFEDWQANQKLWQLTEVYRVLVASTIRLGHSMLDFYQVYVASLTSLRAKKGGHQDHSIDSVELAEDFVALLNQQKENADDTWGVYQELRAVAENYQLLLRLNYSDWQKASVTHYPKILGQAMGTQQPVAGMWGKVNTRLVKQFRLPGYPLVMISTDLLQEGEDLHPFCSRIYHYGISWTPSATEQRIGRIDRVGSQTERKLAFVGSEFDTQKKLQVFFPYLQETVEVFQVRHLLHGLDRFTEMMHKSLILQETGPTSIDLDAEIHREWKAAETESNLETAFPVSQEHLTLPESVLSPTPPFNWRLRLEKIAMANLGFSNVAFETMRDKPLLLGTARLRNGRVQPFGFYLKSIWGKICLQCISPIGLIEIDTLPEYLYQTAKYVPKNLMLYEYDDEASYNVSIDDEVLLGDGDTDATRAAALLRRVLETADFWEEKILAVDQDLSVFIRQLENQGSANE